jgi:hypothetical protein
LASSRGRVQNFEINNQEYAAAQQDIRAPSSAAPEGGVPECGVAFVFPGC